MGGRPVTRADPAAATRIVRRNYGRSHGYQLDGRKALGVTTVVGTLDKPALVTWAARMSAELAVNDWERLGELPIADRLKELSWAHKATNRAATTRGTEIHHHADRLVAGGEIHVPDELRGPVEAYARFLDAWQITSLASETPLGSPTYGYAGTADLWCRIGVRGDAPALVDVKTGKGVYDETALQLAAYRYAELFQPSPGVEVATPEVDRVYVAHVLPDDVRMLPVDAGPEVFRTFLYLLQVAQARAEWSDWPLIGASVRPDEDES